MNALKNTPYKIPRNRAIFHLITGWRPLFLFCVDLSLRHSLNPFSYQVILPGLVHADRVSYDDAIPILIRLSRSPPISADNSRERIGLFGG